MDLEQQTLMFKHLMSARFFYTFNVLCWPWLHLFAKQILKQHYNKKKKKVLYCAKCHMT